MLSSLQRLRFRVSVGALVCFCVVSSTSAARPVWHDATFTPDIVLRVSVATIQLNCQPRLSTLVNGTYPGPPIYLEPERTTWIRVYNDAQVNTTMHWHGLSLSTAPFADGSPQASQWPIPPGHFFDYEVHPQAYEAGTSFYHSHVGFQAITASGALIVKDTSPLPYPYDDEIILKVGDLYPQDDHAIESQLTGVPFTWIGDPTALLVNGQSGTAPNQQTPNSSDSSCQPWTMNVEPDKTYRVRLIGSTSISLVVFGIEDHNNLTIIETDNSYVYPVETSYMQVDSGQRFSFLLKTKSRGELRGRSTFWIQLETRQGERTVSAWALVNYVVEGGRQRPPGPSPGRPYPVPATPTTLTIPSSPVLSLPTDVTTWLEYRFQNPPFAGYDPPPNSSEVTRRVIISSLQFLNNTSGHTVMISNNASWFDSPPLGPTAHTPYLVQILQNSTINGATPDFNRATSNSDSPGLDPLSNTYPARIGEVVEIVWQNAASSPTRVYGAHPMHAHGGQYWDMGSGPRVYDPQNHSALLQAHSVGGGTGAGVGAGTPYPGSRRDTTLLYRYTSQGSYPGEVDGWRVWRVRVTERNVGVWMMHCHILHHILMGQQTVWVFGTPEEIRNHTLPVQGSLNGYFTYGGDAVGKTGGQGPSQSEGKGVRVAQFFE
ncbi:L-ascorbate oxidase [Capronia epimyces CBS 606.96]|uniref:L-ascorbate oxidase n=1 Tax=Capronia epimyces CBS 606.96 TaxID=1182542 RepID=W9YYJ5_9EURO|nr:L-ascorbate oxidase [Capronia epimyces CBS 606.96]EXJ87349.1 L-ascorbate oxidase [Capronia epimyces CBS 606.96]